MSIMVDVIFFVVFKLNFNQVLVCLNNTVINGLVRETYYDIKEFMNRDSSTLHFHNSGQVNASVLLYYLNILCTNIVK